MLHCLFEMSHDKQPLKASHGPAFLQHLFHHMARKPGLSGPSPSHVPGSLHGADWPPPLSSPPNLWSEEADLVAPQPTITLTPGPVTLALPGSNIKEKGSVDEMWMEGGLVPGARPTLQTRF